MNARTVLVPGAAFAASVLAIGWTYWQVPYAQVSLPGTLVGPMLLLVLAIAAAAVAARTAMLPTLAAIAAAPPAVVIARVVRDTALDPTSHNLWPFEVVLAGMVGFAVAFAGLVLGMLVSKAMRVRGRG